MRLKKEHIILKNITRTLKISSAHIIVQTSKALAETHPIDHL